MSTKKIKTHYKLIKLDIFKTCVLVLVFKSRQTIIEDSYTILKRLRLDSDTAKSYNRQISECLLYGGNTSIGKCINLDSGDIVVVFFDDNPSVVSEELITHETHHAANYVCENRGIDDEECETYIQEYLFNKILCYIDEYNDKQEKDGK